MKSIDKKILGTQILSGDKSDIRNKSVFRLGVFADKVLIPNEFSSETPNPTPSTVEFTAGSNLVGHILDARIVSVDITSSVGDISYNDVDWNVNRVSIWNSLFPNNSTYSEANIHSAFNTLNSSNGFSVMFSYITLESIGLNLDVMSELGVDGKVYYMDKDYSKKVADNFKSLPADYMTIYRVVPGTVSTAPTMTFTFVLDILATTGTYTAPNFSHSSYSAGVNPTWVRGVSISDTYTVYIDAETKSVGLSKKLDDAVINSVTSTSFYKKSPDELKEKLLAYGMSDSLAQQKVQKVLDRKIPDSVMDNFNHPELINN